jgi:4-amino-4-deoxy-L-arabinose transferase-like glycosyltransferase
VGAFGRLTNRLIRPPVLAAGSVAFFLFCVLPRLGYPLVYDEVNFALAAEAVAATGRPFARAGFMEDRGALDREFQYALWHPPLYMYALGLAFWLLGPGEAQARAVGVASTLAAGGLLFVLTRRLTGKSWPAAGAVGLFLTHPLTVQSSLLVDIDGSVLLPLFLASVLAGSTLMGRPGVGTVTRAGLAFGLALLAKLTTPLAIPPVLGLTLLARGYGAVAWLIAGAVALIGAGFCAGIWGLFSLGLSLPFTMPLEVTAAEARLALGAGLSGIESGWWLSPPLLILFGWALGRRAATWLGGNKADAADLVTLLGAVVLGVYLARTAGYFPKYQVAAVPLMVAAVATGLGPDIAGLRPQRRALTGAVGAIGGLAAALALRDGPFFQTAGSNGGLPLVAAGSIVAGAGLAPIERLRPIPWAVAGLIGVLAGWGVTTDLMQRSAPYSTAYFYGARGNVEAARLLDRLVGPDEYYVAPKEVAYYAANRNYIDMHTAYALLRDRPAFDGRLLGYTPRVWVLFVRDPGVRAFFESKLGPAYRPAASSGDYVIYVLAQGPPG